MVGEYTLNKTKRFVTGGASFEMATGSRIEVKQEDKQGRKVLIDFGDGLIDWFHKSALNDFDLVDKG